jgi:hypothetical protein
MVLWPRDEAYYNRNRWAGALRDAQGNLVLDSPANNACAHYLHNMLYVLGDAIDRSDPPATVTAELYRAHAITNYDTAAIRIRTVGGVDVLFLVTHASRDLTGPLFSYEFERGLVTFSNETGLLEARFHDGNRTKTYGSPNDEQFRKVWMTMRDIRERTPTLCGIESAEPHTQCTWAAQQSMSEIQPFPPPLIHVEGERGARRTWVEGLDDAMRQCYETFKLPSEIGVVWASRGEEIRVGAMRDA